jgi:alpha-1,2-mannosyltransferase
LLLAILVVGLVTARAMHRGGDTFAADIVVGLVGLVVSPISWSHHFIWVVPALLILSRRGRVAQIQAALCAAVLYAAPIWWVPKTHDREFHHHGWQLVAACSFLVVAVVLALGMRQSSVDERVERADGDRRRASGDRRWQESVRGIFSSR